LPKKYNPLAQSTVDELRTRLEKSSSNFADFERAESFFWFIQSDGEFVGNINCQNLNKQMLTAEVGYNVIFSARSKGIASSSLRTLTQKLFAETPLRKLIAYVHEENLPSIKVLEKVGYKKEGLLREHYLVNGKPANEIIFGILKKEIQSE
jgi:ribosomal-protein-alanine N-acetyltransferase